MSAPAAPSLDGAGAATVFRDASGRRIDIVAEQARAAAARATAAAVSQVERYEWSTGAAQKAGAAAEAAALAAAAAAPFARRAGDSELEASLKARLREGDPMAGLLEAPPARVAGGGVQGDKPRYSGPPAPSNRYGIQPGYRWDGVPRGNGWEAKLVALSARKAAGSEARHKYAVAEM